MIINKHFDLLKKFRAALADASKAFRQNNDLTAASSLAFSAMLALIPALFLLTMLLGAAMGSSARVVQKTQDLLQQLFPAYSQVILREVNFIAGHKSTIGLLNLFVLFWSITPLVADIRVALGRIFRKKPARPYLLEKMFDAAISTVFITGLGAVSVAGVVFSLIGKIQPFRPLPVYLEQIAFFAVLSAVVLALYFTFSHRTRFVHLLAGSLVTALLWFAVRPVFHLFLIYNPGYGFAFGSFKSLFVVVIWIYISLALFLFGAEMAAGLDRAEAAGRSRQTESRKTVPERIIKRFAVRVKKGNVIFKGGDPGNGMFAVLSGRVSIQRDGRETGVISEGKSFGAMSFLLASERASTAIAIDDVELLAVTNDNIADLMSQFPELVLGMLKETVLQVRDTKGDTG